MPETFKAFWKGYSYSIVKMFINQFAIALFGLTLAIATGQSGNGKLQIICSVCAVLFYLFLIYTMTWEVGAADKIRVDAGRAKASPLRGLYMSLFANLPNLILAAIILICSPIASAAKTAGGFRIVALLLEGMYTGLLTVDVGGSPLNAYAWPYLVIILPALLTATLAYLGGLHNFRILGLFGVSYHQQGNKPKNTKKK